MNHTLYLGANFVSHDAAVFGLCGTEVFAISEERFTRFKHDAIWPIHSLAALRAHLVHAGLSYDRIVCGVPMLCANTDHSIDSYSYHRFIRKLLGGLYLKDHLARAEAIDGRVGMLRALFSGLQKGTIGITDFAEFAHTRLSKRPLRDHIEGYLRQVMGDVPVSVEFYDHHDCHAYSTWCLSGFEQALVVTMDGWGDGAFTKIYLADLSGVKCISSSHSVCVAPHDNGLILPAYVANSGIFSELTIGHAYSIITWLLGFWPCADEGKVEALAAYSPPNLELLREFHTTMRIIGHEIVIDRANFLAVFHSPASHARLRALPREVVSSTMQRFLEDVYLALLRALTKDYGCRRVCLAGGVAANVVLNMKAFQELRLDIHVVPAMADDGTAMGAAFLATLNTSPHPDVTWVTTATNGMPYYGTEYSAEETRDYLESDHGFQVQFEYLGDSWPTVCARRICEEQQIGAIFQGRCEFGPRALGNRSIVADLRNPENTARLNILVKNRPGFQPFCPSFMAEEKQRLFDHAYLNMHMTCAFFMKPEFVTELPCAVHVDGTARVQFVTKGTNPTFHRMLSEIKWHTGYGGVLNTSFNKHGRTICESPSDALTDFVDCGIDFLLLNGYLVTRKAQ